MLMGLDNIDWKSLGVADVPKWLRVFASIQEEREWDAYHDFEQQVINMSADPHFIDFGHNTPPILQNNLHALLIPFLLELLEHPAVLAKNHLMYFLETMLSYSKYYKNNIEHQAYAQRIRSLIWSSRHIFFFLLNHPDGIVRLAAMQIINTFTEHIDVSAPYIIRQIEIENNSEIKAGLIWNITEKLIQPKKIHHHLISDLAKVLTKLASPRYDRRIFTIAAVSLANLLEEKTPVEAVNLIVNTLTSFPTPVPITYEYPALYPDKQAKALAKLGEEVGINAAISVIKNSKYRENAMHAITSALVLAFAPQYISNYGYFMEKVLFGLEKPELNSDLNNLTLIQKRVLQVLVETHWLWESDNFMLQSVHLPNDKEVIRKLLL